MDAISMNLDPTAPVRIVENRSPFWIMFNGSVADAYAGGGSDSNSFDKVTNYTAIARSIQEGGRALVNMQSAKWLEVYPLFTTAGATATLRLWGFSWASVRPDLSSDVKAQQIAPTSAHTNLGLGVGYNMGLDQLVAGVPTPATTITLSAFSTAQGVRLYTNVTPKIPLQASGTNGTLYYAGERLMFDSGGLYAFVPIIEAISAGTLLLLGRCL